MNFTFLDIKKGEIHSINFSSVRGILAAKKMRVLKKRDPCWKHPHWREEEGQNLSIMVWKHPHACGEYFIPAAQISYLRNVAIKKLIHSDSFHTGTSPRSRTRSGFFGSISISSALINAGISKKYSAIIAAKIPNTPTNTVQYISTIKFLQLLRYEASPLVWGVLFFLIILFSKRPDILDE